MYREIIELTTECKITGIYTELLCILNIQRLMEVGSVA